MPLPCSTPARGGSASSGSMSTIRFMKPSATGLAGWVWSSDRDRAFGVAGWINSGTVWVNKHLDVRPDTPFAGVKQSGIGAEMGQEGLEEFTQATIINMAK